MIVLLTITFLYHVTINNSTDMNGNVYLKVHKTLNCIFYFTLPMDNSVRCFTKFKILLKM